MRSSKSGEEGVVRKRRVAVQAKPHYFFGLLEAYCSLNMPRYLFYFNLFFDYLKCNL